MKYFGFYILNLKPLVLSCIGYPTELPKWARDCILLEHGAWYHAYWKKMIFYRIRQVHLQRRGIEHHLIVNTPEELSLANRVGVRAKHISQYVYCNEKIFRPMTMDIKFDALYIAKSERFKRHVLAKDIPRLAILKSSGPKVSEFCPEVAHATSNEAILELEEVAKFINQSHCTLALSAEEGGMFASFESLLCGVPVVSTPSRGGRDLFYNVTNSIISKPDSSSVRQAVDHFVIGGSDQDRIRTEAVSRLENLRSEYSSYIAEVLLHRRNDSSDATQHLRARILFRLKTMNLDQLFCQASEPSIPLSITKLLV